jgi:hypothetical protein
MVLPSVYIVYMGAFMAGCRVNFFLTLVIMYMPEKVGTFGRRSMYGNDG